MIKVLMGDEVVQEKTLLQIMLGCCNLEILVDHGLFNSPSHKRELKLDKNTLTIPCI